MISSYDDFLIIENYIKDSNFQLLLEASLSTKVDNNIKFGIVMATHKISDNTSNKERIKKMNTPELLKTSLGSIKNQNYNNWKIYITADCYSNDKEVLDVFDEIIPKDKLSYHNLSKPGERDNTTWTTKQIRYTAGCAALNNSLRMAEKDGCDYIVRLDHDDKWTANHLQTLARAYTQYPELAFVFTRSRKKVAAYNSNKKYFYQPEGDHEMSLNNKGYGDNQTSHSATSWRPSLTGSLRYRNPDKQLNTEPKRKGIGLPADWDMFKRMMDNIKNKGHKYMYIPKVTSYYRNRDGKF